MEVKMVEKKKKVIKKKQRTITKNQLLMLHGLTVLRDEVVKEYRRVEKAIANLVQEPADDCGDYFGHVSDYMWEDFGAKQLLKKLDVKIK